MRQGNPAASPAIRVLVVDDHPAVREGLALLLAAEGIDVCAESGARTGALEHLEESRPDLAIVDLSLDGEDGLVLVGDLKARGVPTLVYSMHNDTRHVAGAFAAGALGYVAKSEFRQVLVEGIRAVACGQRFVSPRAAIALAERLAGSTADENLARLSGKEREVYRLIGEGEGTNEIAAALRISTHTVESYFARIQQKLGLEGMHGLRRHAIDHYHKQAR
ncbi:MAG: response regulator transcription factor [Thermoanaerobaculia bacterium]|nr:response regulator transcription factor [Thermoanaerobaculia bacterium]